MKSLIAVWVLGLSWILLFGQPKWLQTEPKTLEELTSKKEQLLSQLELLNGHREQDAFSHAILKEVTELEKQKVLLMGKLKH